MTVPNGLLSTLRLEPMLETTLRELSAARSELAYTCESRGAVRAHVHHRARSGYVQRLETRSTAAYVKL